MILKVLLTNILIVLLLLKGADAIVGQFLLPATQGTRALEEFRRKDPRYLDRFPGTGTEGNWPDYQYVSWSVWAHRDQRNEHVTIVDGFRPSYEPSCEGTRRKRTAWFFGGSTMIGLGSSQDFTIPSLACKELEARDPGTCWRCPNFGMQAYVSSQELVLFYRLFKEAELGKRERPDLVVFYDGVNELHAALGGHPLEHQFFAGAEKLAEDLRDRPTEYWLRGLVGWVSDRASGFLVGNILARLSSGRSEPGMPAERVAAQLEELAGQYAFNYDVMSQLASGEGLRALFFLQPSLFDKKPLSEFEKWNLGRGRLLGLRFDGELDGLWSRFAARVEERPLKPTRHSRFVSLRGVFVGVPESVFHLPNDWNHANWHGNTLVARRIAEQILAFR